MSRSRPFTALFALILASSAGAQPDSWSLVLWTAGIDGSQPTRIYESGCCKDGFGAPSWSPDGEWIAFGLSMPDEPARTGTYLIRPDGSDLRRVSPEMLDPVWQPIPRDG